MIFTDPINRTFAIFDKGEFLDVESFYMGKNKAGRGFIVYEDLNGNLNYYGNGNKVQLSNFSAKIWEVKDDIVVWSENSYLYTRIKNFFVDQTCKSSIEAMFKNIGNVLFDIIIDDGLHKFEANINLFENSFKHLSKEGMYIIEDVYSKDKEKFFDYFKKSKT